MTWRSSKQSIEAALLDLLKQPHSVILSLAALGHITCLPRHGPDRPGDASSGSGTRRKCAVHRRRRRRRRRCSPSAVLLENSRGFQQRERQNRCLIAARMLSSSRSKGSALKMRDQMGNLCAARGRGKMMEMTDAFASSIARLSLFFLPSLAPCVPSSERAPAGSGARQGLHRLRRRGETSARNKGAHLLQQ